MARLKTRKNEILKYLEPEDQGMFLSDLLKAIRTAKRAGSFRAIDECIEAWEATAELNSIPGFRERVWAKYSKLKEAGIIKE